LAYIDIVELEISKGLPVGVKVQEKNKVPTTAKKITAFKRIEGRIKSLSS
jgi:hypothetical protein